MLQTHVTGTQRGKGSTAERGERVTEVLAPADCPGAQSPALLFRPGPTLHATLAAELPLHLPGCPGLYPRSLTLPPRECPMPGTRLCASAQIPTGASKFPFLGAALCHLLDQTPWVCPFVPCPAPDLPTHLVTPTISRATIYPSLPGIICPLW